tara:strand:- start:206 stop:598 length:393 start_codon:yes stop_codon:yes gene_type:complete
MCILGENENPVIWKKNIFEAIKNLSDIELQKLTWSGKHPKFISSLTETLARLYDDLDFERYIEYYKSINNMDNTYILFEELNKMMNDFKDYGYETELKVEGYKEILNNTKWIAITQKAKEIIFEWNKATT